VQPHALSPRPMHVMRGVHDGAWVTTTRMLVWSCPQIETKLYGTHAWCEFQRLL
jgi:hypothetical protein